MTSFSRRQDIDDEAKLREIDFSEFEELFKLPTAPRLTDSQSRFERSLLKSAELIVFVEANRAKNMSKHRCVNVL